MGRRREFDETEALDAALCVFWRKGYEGASYTDLTAATGVERPGLYAAFGNKEALFRKALERYYERYLAFIPAALELSTSRDVVTEILRGAVELNTRYQQHPGCLAINGALAASDDAESVRQVVIESRGGAETMLRERLERAQTEGDLPADANCATLATYVFAVLHGIAVQAKAGFSRETLHTVANYALANWPSR